MLQKIKTRAMRTSRLMDLYQFYKQEVEWLSAWPLRSLIHSTAMCHVIRQDMCELQHYIIPELKRRGLLKIN